MKAPKNFYNTVDQTKLGLDDLFTRTAENEADITALETVVGDDTTGLVKSVSDLETVVGDLDEGLVKDVHDLKDDSEHYHDDIADLKNADILINNRIDGHLLDETTTSADEGKVMAVDSNGDWVITTPAGGDVVIINATTSNNTDFTLVDYTTWGEMVTSVIASGKVPIVKVSQYSGAVFGIFIPYSISRTSITFSQTYINQYGGVTESILTASDSSGASIALTKIEKLTVPTVSSADNDKILSVVNGHIEWVTPT